MYSTRTKTFLEWACIFRDKITGVVWYCDKNLGIFTIQIFFHRSDENGVFSQFWSFEEKVYFITWIMTINNASKFS